MSFIAISDFIESGKHSLKEKNDWSALSVALMLPSMCSRLAYADNQDYIKRNGDYLHGAWPQCLVPIMHHLYAILQNRSTFLHGTCSQCIPYCVWHRTNSHLGSYFLHSYSTLYPA